ncbi:DnaD domain protein [Agrilactobacillus yilanensis]|uniref:DnaD domain protein n=1 Tax=Agrilactobacillus yilanensis TaxID=2485997 RepID=A0ABW4J952_9LACO|nr:DnaD domain protein [Agrilactobacillus yilanensis]
MNGQDVQFSPRDGFLVTHAGYFNDAQQNYLIYLYQPILGPVAVGLYNTLKTLENPSALRSQRPMHRILLDYMSVDLVAIEAARRRLEAMGLLRTFTNEDVIGKYFVYELYPPLTPDVFFKDDLLSLLLVQTIGQRAFDDLATRFQLHPVTKDLTEITANFSNVFPEIVARAVQTPTELQQTKKQMTLKQRPAVAYSEADLDTFDWDFLQNLLAKFQVTKAELTKHQQVIYQLHHFYGIDETTMANLIANTLDIVTDEINIKKLESLTLAEYTQTQGSQVKMAPEPETPTPPQTSASQSDAPTAQADSTQELVAQAQRLSVFDFLAWQKQVLGGFVGKGETRVLRELQSRHIFSDQILNMLTYANLHTAGATTVTQAFTDSVANDWLQHHITTPEAALKRIQERQYTKLGKTAKTNNNSRQNYRTTSPTKTVEPIPSWFKEQTSATSEADDS